LEKGRTTGHPLSGFVLLDEKRRGGHKSASIPVLGVEEAEECESRHHVDTEFFEGARTGPQTFGVSSLHFNFPKGEQDMIHAVRSI
jgi:hypothetical protein